MPGSDEYTRMRTVEPPSPADVLAAADRIRAHLRPTPVVESDGFSLKLESLQPTGSFKVRGALAALTALEPGTKVVTASAGNHGLALAWAAERLGFDATIVVAETASPAKIEGIRRYPATLVVHGLDYDEAERHALSLEGTYVSPYNDRHVIAGAGTVALELDDVETIVVPVGGGGLASGIALASDARVTRGVPGAVPAVRAAPRGGRPPRPAASSRRAAATPSPTGCTGTSSRGASRSNSSATTSTTSSPSPRTSSRRRCDTSPLRTASSSRAPARLQSQRSGPAKPREGWRSSAAATSRRLASTQCYTAAGSRAAITPSAASRLGAYPVTAPMNVSLSSA